jgi:hypothetical protein
MKKHKPKKKKAETYEIDDLFKDVGEMDRTIYDEKEKNIKTKKVKPLQFIKDNKLNYFNCVLWYDENRSVKDMMCPKQWNDSNYDDPKHIQSTKDKIYNNNGNK